MISLLGGLKRVLIVIPIFKTFGWTQRCLISLRHYLPDIPVLVVDNNPSTTDSSKRWCSYASSESTYGVSTSWTRYCEAESHWVRHIPGVEVIKTPIFFRHPQCLNLGLFYAYRNEYDMIISLEPDCEVRGVKWYDAFVSAIHEGYWMAGGERHPLGPLRVTPAIYRTDALMSGGMSFSATAIPLQDTSLRQHYDVDHYEEYFENNNAKMRDFDTGHMLWFQCAKKQRAKHVKADDIVHHTRGSLRRCPWCDVFLHL